MTLTSTQQVILAIIIDVVLLVSIGVAILRKARSRHASPPIVARKEH